MALSDVAVRNAKPSAKARKLYDERGLFLLVNPNGSKWWRLKYRFADREKLLSLGIYPDVPLKSAREQRDLARQQIASGIDPSEARKALKAQARAAVETFKSIALEWLVRRSPGWAEGHGDKIKRRLEVDVFPQIGSLAIAAVTAPELLKMAKLIESRGAVDTAHRALQNCSQIIRYAIATGRATHDPTPALRGALTPTREKHYASITDPKAVGALLRALDGYQGSHVTRAALKLAPLVFVRPGELRQAQWSEFDLAKSEWRIPAERMKMRQPHVVPLATQAVEILRGLHAQTGGGKFLFPGARGRGRFMSENTVNAAIRRLGYAKGDMTGHGFRSMASTLLNEQGWNRDAIERQLAHQERDAIRAAYNYAEHLPERRKMMQAWADYLALLQAGPNVHPFPVARTA